MRSPAPLLVPALHASHAGVWIADPSGEVRRVDRAEAIGRAGDTPLILLNAPLVAERLRVSELSGLDLLELFAFVHPAAFAVPTPAGLARALGVAPPEREADAARTLLVLAERMLARMMEAGWDRRDGAHASAAALARARWPWAGAVTARLLPPASHERSVFLKLPEWEEQPPRGAPRPFVVSDQSSLERLDQLTGEGAERRPGQRDYAARVGHMLGPRPSADGPAVLMAEAGTGIGKTLGYLAPTTLWAAGADGAVWVSTYTKALQRQLSAETARIYPDPAERARRVVVRKGRENYLCLLNLEDAVQGGFAGRAAILAHLVARWAAWTRDGDMVGGDLPGWLPQLFRRSGAAALTDRRGECVFAGCPHYRRCFIERSARASQHADLVIANHALVMVNAARGRESQPTRIVFDEGHHLHDAADSMFSAALTGSEMIELRRWILGPEGRARGRRRGLAARLADVASYDEEGGRAIARALDAATALPAEGWLARLVAGEPDGEGERFLSAVRATIWARDESGSADAGYGLECELADPPGSLVDASAAMAEALAAIHRPLVRLGHSLEALLEQPPDWMDATARARVDGALLALAWRRDTLSSWIAMAIGIGGPRDDRFVDWLNLARFDGREWDVGVHRHWLDPGVPLAEAVLKPAHGVLVTSATLTAGGDWDEADRRAGVAHLDRPAEHFVAPSPFDYAARSEVLIVTDVARGNGAALAGAYATLIEAAGGGTLGLFTAIRRLRATHARIADRLADLGLPLHAQHVDPIDTGTLVDIFRDDPRASLLGTDALRDGVDVPGESLRLVVIEGVPWPKPSVLHRARRAVGGGSTYDDRLIRARLAQAFGRLIRRAEDRGVFVLLSAAVPTRLLTAFPPGTPIERLPLAAAADRVRRRLASGDALRHEASGAPTEIA